MRLDGYPEGFSEKSDKYLAEWSPFLTDFISTALSDGGTFRHQKGIWNTRAAELAASHTFVRENWDELATIIKQLQSTLAHVMGTHFSSYCNMSKQKPITRGQWENCMNPRI